MKEVAAKYINHFIHCHTHWTDTWDCTCDDDCPICHWEIEPFASAEIDENGNVVETIWHVDPKTWVPDGGWPESVRDSRMWHRAGIGLGFRDTKPLRSGR